MHGDKKVKIVKIIGDIKSSGNCMRVVYHYYVSYFHNAMISIPSSTFFKSNQD